MAVAELVVMLAQAVWCLARLDQLELHRRHVTSAMLRVMVPFSASMFAIGVATQIAVYSSGLVVAAALGATAVATYTVAVRAVDGASLLLAQFSDVFLPVFARLGRDSEQDRSTTLLRLGTRLGLVLGYPLIALLIGLGEPLVEVWVGDGFEASWGPLALLAASLIFAVPLRFGLLWAIGTGRQGRIAIVALCDSLANIAAAITLVGPLGLEGVALAALGALWISNGLIMPRLIYPRRGCQAVSGYYRPTLLALGAMAPCVLVMRFALTPRLDNPAPTLLATIAWLILGTALLAVLLTDKEEREQLRGMIPQMRLSVVIPTRDRRARWSRRWTASTPRRSTRARPSCGRRQRLARRHFPRCSSGWPTAPRRLELRVVTHAAPGASARNAGMRAAVGDVVLFLGDDTAPARSRPARGATSARTTPPPTPRTPTRPRGLGAAAADHAADALARARPPVRVRDDAGGTGGPGALLHRPPLPQGGGALAAAGASTSAWRSTSRTLERGKRLFRGKLRLNIPPASSSSMTTRSPSPVGSEGRDGPAPRPAASRHPRPRRAARPSARGLGLGRPPGCPPPRRPPSFGMAGPAPPATCPPLRGRSRRRLRARGGGPGERGGLMAIPGSPAPAQAGAGALCPRTTGR